MLLDILKEPFKRNVILIYGITFLIILPTVLQNLKHSPYYREPYNESIALRDHQLENNLRLNASRIYLSGIKGDNVSKVNSQSKYDVLISVITTSRNRHIADGYKPHYLTQVTQKLLQEMDRVNSEDINIGLLICNVDSNPSFYEEALYLSKIVSVVNRFSQIHLSIIDTLEKEKQDYVFCLNNSFSNYHARYHFLVEDDTLPKDNMIEVLQFTINRHLDMNYGRGVVTPNTPAVLYVKFYHPERLLSYFSMEFTRLAELFGLSFVLSSAMVAILRYFTRPGRYCTLWIICTFYVLLLLVSFGRVNVNEMRQYLSPYLHSYSPSPSCCTPALLFTNRTIQSVINHMHKNTCTRNFGKDSLLDQLVMKTDASAYIVEPNSFKHIGMYSALRNTVVHSSFV